MQQHKKKLMIVAAILLVAICFGLIAGQKYLGGIVKKTETRKEIEGLIEAALSELLTRPRVTVESLSLKGFSTLLLDSVKVYDGKELLFTAPKNMVQCSIFGQIFLARCDLKAQIGLGNDGTLTFNMTLPRSLFFAGNDYQYDLLGEGRVERFNVFKILNQKSSSSEAPLKLKLALADGSYKFSLIGRGQVEPVVEFDGAISQALVEVNARGKRQEKIAISGLAFSIARNKISFTKPVEVSLLGSKLRYTGALGLEQQLSWQGALQISSAGVFSQLVPALLNCKSKPTNPSSFKISGLVGAPLCR
jgi:hypothetical protein